jgi:peptide/nickel transport system substrate-binding protein
MTMALDSVPLVEKVKGARLMKVPGAGEANVFIYGQGYVGIGTPDQLPFYDPSLPWVSSNPVVGSPEWEKARKVRLALAIAIDRQAIVDTVLRGFGRPLVMGTWTGHEDRLPPDMKWEFNQKRARELLAEAGYPRGFSLTLTPSIRGAPAETEACELVGNMWRDIGIDVKLQKVPYSTLRPQLIGRTYKGFTCHASSPTLVPVAGWASWTSKKTHKSVYYRGAEHDWLDEWVRKTQQAVDPKEREELELKVTRFMYHNVLTSVGLYVFDNVFALGPRVEEWTQHIRLGDTRNINGFEWAQHRKER